METTSVCAENVRDGTFLLYFLNKCQILVGHHEIINWNYELEISGVCSVCMYLFVSGSTEIVR